MKDSPGLGKRRYHTCLAEQKQGEGSGMVPTYNPNTQEDHRGRRIAMSSRLVWVTD